MRLSASALVMGACMAGQTIAALHRAMRHSRLARHAEISRTHREPRGVLGRRDEALLSPDDATMLHNLGVTTLGLNPTTSGQVPWVGEDGRFTNEFTNQSGQDCILVVWGPSGSWVNKVPPQITISMLSGASRVISFPNGWSGAWAPVHNGTTLVNGQISETWGEGTFNPPFSVVDVSREVNMDGRSMSIVGPVCKSDMDTCVFKCPPGQQSCTTGYSLDNCDPKVQLGANYGIYNGAPSGGCGGMGNTTALHTYLG